MKFLVVTKITSPMPPEMAIGLMDALTAWAKKYTANKKIEQIWHFAGLLGGCGIANVNSLEELDAIQAEFPMGIFSKTEIYPLVDMQEAAQRVKQAFQAMIPPKK